MLTAYEKRIKRNDFETSLNEYTSQGINSHVCQKRICVKKKKKKTEYEYFRQYAQCRFLTFYLVVVLPDPFRDKGAWRNSTETQQSSHALRSGPDVKNGRSSDKDGAPERLRRGTI